MDKSEKIIAHVRGTLGTAEKHFDKEFAISRHQLRSSFSEKSVNDIDAVKRKIMGYVKQGIMRIDWEDPKAIDEFCGELEQTIAQTQDRFTKAWGRVQGVNPQERWNEFVAWLRDLRLKTRDEILAELKTEEKILGVEPEPQEPQASVADVAPDLLLEDVPGEPVGDGLVAHGSQLEDTRLPDIVTRKEEQKPAVKQEITPESIIDFGQQGGLSDELLDDVRLAIGELEVGTDKRILDAFKVLVESLVKVHAAGRESERSWARMATDFYERDEELQGEIALRDENLAKARLEAEAGREAVQQRDAVIGELRAQLKDASEKNAELERTISAERTSLDEARRSLIPSVPEKIEPEPTHDFEKERTALADEWTRLDEEESRLSGASIELAEWLSRFQTELKQRLLRERFTTDAKDPDSVLQRVEDRAKMMTDPYREQHTLIESAIRAIQSRKRQVSNRLRALQVVMGDPLPPDVERGEVQVPNIPPLDDFIAAAFSVAGLPTTPIVDAPSQEELVPDVRVIPERDEASIVSTETSPDLAELVFDVELKEGEMQRVREMELFLQRLQAMDESEIEQSLETVSGDQEKDAARNEKCAELAKEIKNGKFLAWLKKAIVVLGALRRDGEFATRVTSTIGHAASSKAVGLVKVGSADLGRLSSVFSQMALVAQKFPEWRLFTRQNVGNKYAAANALTPLGRSCSKVWLRDLLVSGQITLNQLNGIHAFIQGRDAEAAKSKEKPTVKGTEEKK